MNGPRARGLRVLLAVVVPVAIMAVACAEGDEALPATTTTPQPGPDGIVLAVDGWARCLNPITTCAADPALAHTVTQHVLPRLMEYGADGLPRASPVLVEAPTLENGGLTEDPFTITYRIRDEAVWSDGTPITSADIAFTHTAQFDSGGSLARSGYGFITDIDSTDPKTAILTFDRPYAPWPELFGGSHGFVLKEAAFEDTDLSDDMLTSIDFSGGPFELEEWSRSSAVLVPNERYWYEERRPAAERVTFVPLEGTEEQVDALKAGTVAAVYVEANDQTLGDLGSPVIETRLGGLAVVEGIWFNHSVWPIESHIVRQAVFLALDREALVAEAVGPEVGAAAMVDCAGWLPTAGEWCGDEFANGIVADQETRDAAVGMAAALAELGEAGLPSPDREASPLTLTTTDDPDRRRVAELAVAQLVAAGLDSRLEVVNAEELLDERLPALDYELGLYGRQLGPDPSVTRLYGCLHIPSEQNDFAGQNQIGWCNELAEAASRRADAALDPVERAAHLYVTGLHTLADMAWIPLYQRPVVAAWRTDQLAGPVGEDVSSVYGMWGNLYAWQPAG